MSRRLELNPNEMELFGVKVNREDFDSYRLEWNPYENKEQCQKCGKTFENDLPVIGRKRVDNNKFKLYSCPNCGTLLYHGPLDDY